MSWMKVIHKMHVLCGRLCYFEKVTRKPVKDDLWDLAPCSLVETGQCFRGAYCLHDQDDESWMTEVVSTSEMSANFYETIWCYIPEDSHLHTHRCENLKSQNLFTQ
jgi:hypothetical protein